MGIGHWALGIGHYSLLITHYSLLITYYSLLITPPYAHPPPTSRLTRFLRRF
jgi:hypothetical protein